jgi:hypothetical protein
MRLTNYSKLNIESNKEIKIKKLKLKLKLKLK